MKENQESNWNDLFNPKVETADPKGSVSEEYSPSAAKGKNNVYQSIIRFIPYWQSPKQSIKDKWVCWLVDPITEKGRFVDCPSSVGKPSPLQDVYWKLKKNESVQMQKMAETFSRRHNYASLIQVIRDENNKDLEGKILVWRYGIKIWEKINAELKPIIGEPQDPFDILNGKAFALTITKVSGFNNYDQSKFVDKRIPLCMPDDNGKFMPITTKTDKKSVFEYVKANSPELSKYEYKEWDQETHDYVNHIILQVTGQGSVSSNFAAAKNGVNNPNTATGQAKPAQKPKTSGITASELSLDDITNNSSDLDDLNLDGISTDGIGVDLDDIINNS